MNLKTLTTGDIGTTKKGYVKVTLEFYDGKCLRYREWQGKEKKLYTDLSMQIATATTKPKKK